MALAPAPAAAAVSPADAALLVEVSADAAFASKEAAAASMFIVSGWPHEEELIATASPEDTGAATGAASLYLRFKLVWTARASIDATSSSTGRRFLGQCMIRKIG
jgi:hypothetical protein